MPKFKQEWDVDMAMTVLEHKTIDSDIWAEAVEWLMLYGPAEIKDILSQASNMATNQEFPELTPAGYNKDGSPLYDIAQLAESLGVSAEETKARLQQKEQDQQTQHLFSDQERLKMQ